ELLAAERAVGDRRELGNRGCLFLGRHWWLGRRLLRRRRRGGVAKWRLLGRDHRRRFRRLRLPWRLLFWPRILRGERFVRLSLLGIARDGLLGLPFVRLDRAFQLSERPLLWSAILLVFQKEYEEDGPDGHHGDAYAAQGKQKSARTFLFPRPRRFVAV